MLLLMMSGCTHNWATSQAEAGGLPASEATPGQTGTTPPDPDKMYKSVVEYRYVPVPVPGQLMSMPSFEGVRKKGEGAQNKSGINAVTQANKRALKGPHSDEYFNSMLTYAFMPGAVYTIYTASGRITDITLQPGEKIENIATGDSANWQVQTSPSGTGKNQLSHILVKPIIAEAGDNTMVILTNRRTYHLYLKMTTNDTFMISVKWHYPDDKDSMFVTAKSGKFSGAPADSVDPSAVQFSYQWAVVRGAKPSWFPVQVFHNSTKTYIRFPSDFTNQMQLPIIYVPDGNGGYSTMTNWRLLNKNTMVVDGVLTRALLETGSKKGKRDSVEIRMLAGAHP